MNKEIDLLNELIEIKKKINKILILSKNYKGDTYTISEKDMNIIFKLIKEAEKIKQEIK